MKHLATHTVWGLDIILSLPKGSRVLRVLEPGFNTGSSLSVLVETPAEYVAEWVSKRILTVPIYSQQDIPNELEFVGVYQDWAIFAETEKA